MPNGTFLQAPTAPSSTSQSHLTTPQTTDTTPNAMAPPPASQQQVDPSNDAATKFAEAIDEFLGDLERKFRVVSDDVLNKLDDMAERCDRLEAELLMREASGSPTPVKKD